MIKFILAFLLFISAQGMAMTFTLKSAAFTHNGLIPAKYTCNGVNISPPLNWSGAPAATKSFVLIMDDPDAPAGTWDHWVLFNIPVTTHELSENAKNFPAGTKRGSNSWHHSNYGGPCPPSGIHRYFFKLYALDALLDLPEGATKRDIENAMQNHTLATAELMGEYQQSN